MDVGTPVDNPTSGTVLATSRLVTSPRRYRVRVSIAAEQPFWARFVHRGADGAEKESVMLPVGGLMLGPLEVGEMYFGALEYGAVEVRDGINVAGTVQASVELL